jgi:hypothetical protein
LDENGKKKRLRSKRNLHGRRKPQCYDHGSHTSNHRKGVSMEGVTHPKAMAMLHAQNALLCAVAATHPRPAQLQAAFAQESERVMATALGAPTDEVFVQALAYWIAEFQSAIDRGTQRSRPT